MRVLFLTHRLPYAPNRGDRIRAYHMLRALGERLSVDVLSLVHDKNEASQRRHLEPLVDSVTLAPVPGAQNRARAVLALIGGTPLTHVLLDSPAMGPALAQIRSTRPPDVVLAYCSGMAQYLFHPSLEGIPAIIDMVDIDSEKWAELGRTTAPPRSWIFRREARVLRQFEARAASRVFANLTVNDRERVLLKTIAPSASVTTVSNGIDSALFAPKQAAAISSDVVFCGVMSYGPNEDAVRWMCERVWPLVRRTRPDTRFIIIGAEPTMAVRSLQNEAAGVVVTGDVPDVRPYLWNAAVAVAPLRVARGLQNKVLEAVAAGLPCVVTPRVADGLPAEVLPACRSAENADEFAAAVLALIGLGPEDRRAIALRAQMTSLDWTTRLEPLFTLIQAAAAGRTGVAADRH